jgi:hypothetical protein
MVAAEAVLMEGRSMDRTRGYSELGARRFGADDQPRDEHGRFAAGGRARFDGKSADGKVTGSMDVTVLDPHSNAHEVAQTTGKGKHVRQYDKDGHRHLPTATVKSDRGTIFEAYHHTLQAK